MYSQADSGEWIAGGKGDCRRLEGGCDLALERDGGGLDWVEAMDLARSALSFWVDDAMERIGFLECKWKESS